MRKTRKDFEEMAKKNFELGETLGVSRINQLILELSKLGRTDDIVKAAADEEYQKKLLEEFDL